MDPGNNVLLKALFKSIVHNRGAVFEGDVFSVLRRSPSIVRAFEFAPADGAIDCTREYDEGSNFADRFWILNQNQRVETQPSVLVLFDVKSSITHDPRHQKYQTFTSDQYRDVAFWIGISAADPGLVEVIPNPDQGQQEPHTTADQSAPSVDPGSNRGVYHALSVNWIHRLPPRAFGVNLCGSPYRMPLTLLPEAIARVRRCITHDDVYTNPWTEVSWPNWRPPQRHVQALQPHESQQHYSAYIEVQEIYRVIHAHPTSMNMELDFIGLQPRLADFKLMVDSDMDGGPRRQVFVQHKCDTVARSVGRPLTDVNIARKDSDGRWRWHFEAHAR